MKEQSEFNKNIRSIERYFLNTQKGAFLFCVADDELLQKNVNNTITNILKAKKYDLVPFCFEKDYNQDLSIADNIYNTINGKKCEGIIINGIEYVIINNIIPNFFALLNFAREDLLKQNVPIMFWVNSELVSKISFNAPDIYNQRVSVIYFDEKLNPETQQFGNAYVMEAIAEANPHIKELSNRIKLLNEQLLKAKEQKWDNAKIANGIVIELLKTYAEIPQSENAINNLLELYESYFDTSNPEIAFKLAYTYKSINSYQKAEEFYIKTLNVYKNSAIENPQIFLSDVASILNNLGNLQAGKNELTKAEHSYQEALEIKKKLSEDNPQRFLSSVATTLNNLGNLQKAKNEFSKAEHSYQQALEIRKKLSEVNPQMFLPKVATTLNNLGNLQAGKNEFSKAEHSYQEALRIRKKLSEDNPQRFLPEVAITLNNLGILQKDKNEFSKAEHSYQEALEITKKLSEDNPQRFLSSVATTLNNLGNLQAGKNEFSKAEHSYQEALRIRKKLSEDNPQRFLPEVATTLNNLGNLQVAQNEFSKAEHSYQKAFEIRKNFLKDNLQRFLPDVVETLINIMFLHIETENKEIENDIKEATQMIELLKDHPKYSSYLENINFIKNEIKK